mmetsp:Transcript_96589/g.144585  ORF Transcript_96589/g.144585 Transcript_96589/m.144585 type:complete len:482 (+) Transcript_96589:79-1524(+)
MCTARSSFTMLLTSTSRMLCLLGMVVAQQPGTNEVELGPRMPLKQCTVAAGCSVSDRSITLDANWRWIHNKDGYANCYQDDSTWDPRFCPDGARCAANCALEGVTFSGYESSYGIKEAPEGVELKFVSRTQYGANYGSRVYMKDGDDNYMMFKLKNREFTMDVDVAHLPCGLNGAVYFVEMDEFGGAGRHGNNRAGAKYGTGYCDAQCPHDVKFIDGEANSQNWNSTSNPPLGHYGACCMEMDIWEANSMATSYTPHPCNTVGLERCEGLTCGDNDSGDRYRGVCDKDGCDFNPFRMGEHDYYGASASFTVDTTKPMTVVTQFLTTDSTDDGDLSEIRRFYVQDGREIPNSRATILGPDAADSVTDGFCTAQKNAFGDRNDFAVKGGLQKMGEALDRGVVLVMSLWDDSLVNMLWLDSAYPTDQARDTPGVARGPCPGGESSTPHFVRERYPDASVKFTNVAVGEIGSTVATARRLGATII